MKQPQQVLPYRVAGLDYSNDYPTAKELRAINRAENMAALYEPDMRAQQLSASASSNRNPAQEIQNFDNAQRARYQALSANPQFFQAGPGVGGSSSDFQKWQEDYLTKRNDLMGRYGVDAKLPSWVAKSPSGGVRQTSGMGQRYQSQLEDQQNQIQQLKKLLQQQAQQPSSVFSALSNGFRLPNY